MAETTAIDTSWASGRKERFVNEGSRKTALVIGAMAAAAGIAVVSGLLIRRRRYGRPHESLHSVSEVLNECYRKLGDIQGHLSDIAGATTPTPTR